VKQVVQFGCRVAASVAQLGAERSYGTQYSL
jgi:hypothetical protein